MMMMMMAGYGGWQSHQQQTEDSTRGGPLALRDAGAVAAVIDIIYVLVSAMDPGTRRVRNEWVVTARVLHRL